MYPTKKYVTFDEFLAIDLRVGTVIRAAYFEKAHKPAIKLWIDFGTLGVKKSSAQITQRYKPERLLNRQIIAVVNFPPKQIANFVSECLVLGVINEQNEVILLKSEQYVDNGCQIK